MAFKELGKDVISRPANVTDDVTTPLEVEEATRDTLYFNAFTEDLFSWDNDLDNDQQRVLKINQDSHFLMACKNLRWRIVFVLYYNVMLILIFKLIMRAGQLTLNERFRMMMIHMKLLSTLKFLVVKKIFCLVFLLAVAQLAIDGQEAYSWVKYLYIDDPISSLDDHNAISVASHLSQLLKAANGSIKTVISSHHALFSM